jgi:cation diffusion facilitator CzcD-associated flavoprotein CzcO
VRPSPREAIDALIVGTGFSGLAAAIKLQERGTPYAILERGDDIGGTWRDNTYPGCRCDVPSPLYSFSFAPNPEWSELYSPQPEIQAYLRKVAVDHDVLGHVRFGTMMTGAEWDDEAQRWAIATTAGPLSARLLVLGNGPLSEPSYPDIEGLDTFAGPVIHSAQWDHSVDLSGKRVAVVGTGASAVQIVPHVQRLAESVVLFQRTPAWILPHPNRPITEVERRVYRRFPLAQKLVRFALYCFLEVGALGLTRRPPLTNVLRRVGLRYLKREVKDPAKRRMLTPDYQPGCKRLLPSKDFLGAVDQPNVTLIPEGLTTVDEHAVVTADGTRHEVDVIVLGTGFRVTDNPAMHLLTGKDGATVAQVWKDIGMGAHLGSTVPGFPNMAFLAGPNTGIGHTSLVLMIEAQVRYLMGALDELDRRGATTFEVKQSAYDVFNQDVQRRMQQTVWSTGGCQSWYLDDQGRNPTLWPDFTFRFLQKTRRFDAESYVYRTAPTPAQEAVRCIQRSFNRGHKPETVATAVLHAVAADKAVVAAGFEARVGWHLQKVLPLVVQELVGRPAPSWLTRDK